VVATDVRGVTRPREQVALGLGLVVIFAVAMVAGVGSEGDAPVNGQTGRGEGSPELRTAAVTVVLGFFVVVLGQLAQRLLIVPIQEQKRTIGKVTHALTYHRNVDRDSPADRIAEARTAYREPSAELRMNLRVLPLYGLFSQLRLVLPEGQVRRGAAALIGLANTVQKGPEAEDMLKYSADVRKNLEIES
jgi:hypothetical protein